MVAINHLYVQFKLVRPLAVTPRYHSEQAAGMDLHVCLDHEDDYRVIPPHQRILLPTGVSMALPRGYEAQVRPRSGFAYKHGIVAIVGTIDSDYRGEIHINAHNLTATSVVIKHNQRIAQLVVTPVMHVVWQPVDELPQTDRAEGGFGSTGK